MALLEMLGFKKAPTAKQLRDMLPALHSFVDMAIKSGPKGSVCFENTGIKTFVTSAIAGMSAGQSATFLYTNAHGKFRFSTTVTSVDAKQATFALPERIEVVQKFTGARQRTNVRVDTTVAVQWRYAPLGKIQSEWQKGTVSDISRTGASLLSDRSIKATTVLEVKMPILANGAVLTLRAEAKRVDAIEHSKKFNVGLRYLPLKPDDDRAILDFINRRQTDLRQRGLG